MPRTAASCNLHYTKHSNKAFVIFLSKFFQFPHLTKLSYFKSLSTEFYKHKTSSSRQIRVNKIASTRMTLSQWFVLEACVYSIESAVSFVISAQNDFVSSWKFDSNAIIGERSFGVEVENKNVTVSFKSDDFIALMCPSDVARIHVQPAIFFFCQVHVTIEVVEKFVLQCRIVCESNQ